MKAIRVYQKGKEIAYTFPSANRTYTVQIANNVQKISLVGSGQNDVSEQLLDAQHFNKELSCLGEYCFRGCVNVDGMYLSPQIRDINKRCFSGCSQIKTVSYGIYEQEEPVASTEKPNLQHIGERAFADCPDLRSITLPESIASIQQLDANAFAGSNITSVTFLGIDAKDLTV